VLRSHCHSCLESPWLCMARVALCLLVPCRGSRGHSPSRLLLRFVTWLHPPRGRVAPPTVVDVAGDIDRCLACHLADRDGLTQVTRGDRDDRVDVAAVRAALSAWNGHVMVRQPVAGPVEAWHALRRGLEHVVDLNDAFMKRTIATTIMPTTAKLTAPSSCLPSHVSVNIVSSWMFVWLPQRGWRDNESIEMEATTCGQGRVWTT